MLLMVWCLVLDPVIQWCSCLMVLEPPLYLYCWGVKWYQCIELSSSCMQGKSTLALCVVFLVLNIHFNDFKNHFVGKRYSCKAVFIACGWSGFDSHHHIYSTLWALTRETWSTEPDVIHQHCWMWPLLPKCIYLLDQFCCFLLEINCELSPEKFL